MQNLLEMGVKSHEARLKSEFYHICLSVCLCAIDVWSRSSFRVTPCRLPLCWQNNWLCTEISHFTDYNKTHFCRKFLIHSLNMKPLYWFKWCKWLKWHLKSPRNFRSPPRILPKIFIFYTMLTYTFVTPSSKQKHTTGSQTHTHTQHTRPATTNKRQLGMSHLLLMVISLAQMLLLCAKFWPLQVNLISELHVPHRQWQTVLGWHF